MTDQSSIFTSQNQEATPPVVPPSSNGENVPNNSLADLLSTIKNERGEPKYKDATEALNGLKHAQEYIPTLKQELSQKDIELQVLRAENQRLKSVEETVLELTQQRASQERQPTSQGLNAEQIAELVNQSLSQREAKVSQASNLQSVVASLQQSFGADAEKVFYDKAKELGMSVVEMNALAAKSPKAVLSMLNVKTEHKTVQPFSQGTVNTNAYQPKQDSFIGRNPKSALIGATTQDIQEASNRAKNMVTELHAAGMSVHDLSDPKIYNKYFK